MSAKISIDRTTHYTIKTTTRYKYVLLRSPKATKDLSYRDEVPNVDQPSP